MGGSPEAYCKSWLNAVQFCKFPDQQFLLGSNSGRIFRKPSEVENSPRPEKNASNSQGQSGEIIAAGMSKLIGILIHPGFDGGGGGGHEIGP
jgi:hypothetical protein